MNETADNRITNPSHNNDSFQQICERRLTRRGFVKASALLGAGVGSVQLSACSDTNSNLSSSPSTSRYDFIEIEHGGDENHLVAPDHEAKVLIRWGDPLFRNSPEFDPNNQSGEAQKLQFGYNNDYVGYLGLEPKSGQDARALLCVNHEYPIPGLMFPNFPEDGYDKVTAEQVAITQASVGNSIVEVVLQNGEWHVDSESAYNRRIQCLDTEIEVSGPAAGHPRMRTTADKEGTNVIGTTNNCAGGMTPWGTYLTCEENFNFHFSGKLDDSHPEAQNHKRYNVPSAYFAWGDHDERFDISKEANEANRFGWVVEIDPLDPTSKPKKRTALGRFKHEGGETIVSTDGRLVVYMGDDQRFEYLYKFVSRDQVNLENPKANHDLLDHGTLYTAKFYDDGSLEWLPLVHDNELLKNEFDSQAEVLIEARRAADLLGATPLDRPEDVVPNKVNGKVYVMLTNNSKRTETDNASPRANNLFGHIVEITELDNNFSNTKGKWDFLVKCGNPDIESHDTEWNPNISKNGWFASPDNAVVDPSGRLWVASDQGRSAFMTGTNDGLWALETEGPLRGSGKMFFRVPMGAELCGPIFSDDGESLFVAVQHPGERDESGGVRVENASTLWPDFIDGMPPRPSVMAIRKKVGGKVG